MEKILSTSHRPVLAILGLILLLPAMPLSDLPGAEPSAGEQIYQQKCAECHGPKGEGTDYYSDTLVGDRPLVELAELIEKTMPEGSPEDCVGEEAKQVAAYMYDEFYSPMAQARNRPAKIEFSRLTVRQYQNAVADLVGSFRSPGKWDDLRGLSGEYYDSRRFRRDKRIFTQLDPTIDFDFDESSPDAEKIKPEEFSMRWEGAVLAPETGTYEFILHAENGARLWVNDSETALIDAWVRSGDQTDHRKSITLLGGRVYPIRLEFFKSEKDDSAAVALKWKPPHQTEQVIPERNLSPTRFPDVLVVETPFPPDDRSTGYERASSVSKEWAQATTYAALEVAGKVADDLRDLAGVRDDESDRAEQLRDFCYRFAERAFRRPLTEEQKQLFVDRQFAEAPNPETAVKRVVLLVLKSPRFLYRDFGIGQLDDYDVASWISFALWDSLPDQPLLDAAAKGELKSREQISAQARRMVNDLRTRSKVRAFFHQWLHFDRFHDLSKDGELYPEFDEELVSDLRTSLDLFLDEVVWSEDSDFRRLLLSDEIYLNGRLAQFYGEDLPPDAPFQKVSFEPQHRAGILSHPYLMSGLAYYSTSSPIHRGVFVARSVLGRFLKPPPEAVSPLSPDLHPDLTTRERVILQTSATSCMSCHSMINPLGFSLEQFDAVGRYRSEERGRPIDALGSYRTQSGDLVEFVGARGLAEFLVNSPEVHEAFVELLFQDLNKQPVQAFGPDQLAELRQSFTENDFNIRKLLVDIATESATKVRDLNQ